MQDGAAAGAFWAIFFTNIYYCQESFEILYCVISFQMHILNSIAVQICCSWSISSVFCCFYYPLLPRSRVLSSPGPLAGGKHVCGDFLSFLGGQDPTESLDKAGGVHLISHVGPTDKKLCVCCFVKLSLTNIIVTVCVCCFVF